MKKFLSANELVTHVSYDIAFQMAKHGKSYVDGEFYKQMLQSTITTLCQDWDDKFKAPLLEKVKLLPLSRQTISRRVNDIGGEIEAKLKSDLERCDAFSLALDETTDIIDTSQLLFWIRYVVDGRIEENLLALRPLTGRTRAEDIFKAFLSVVDRFNLDLKKLVSVCTDGAPAMLGIHAGFVALIKNHIEKHFKTDLFVSFHCIIHQENLCASALEKNNDVLKIMTKVSQNKIAVQIRRILFIFYVLIIFCFLFTDHQ